MDATGKISGSDSPGYGGSGTGSELFAPFVAIWRPFWAVESPSCSICFVYCVHVCFFLFTARNWMFSCVKDIALFIATSQPVTGWFRMQSAEIGGVLDLWSKKGFNWRCLVLQSNVCLGWNRGEIGGCTSRAASWKRRGGVLSWILSCKSNISEMELFH